MANVPFAHACGTVRQMSQWFGKLVRASKKNAAFQLRAPGGKWQCVAVSMTDDKEPVESQAKK
jgi:hypothetical protein